MSALVKTYDPAKVMKDVTEIKDMGFLSIIVDPTGAMLGLWQTKG